MYISVSQAREIIGCKANRSIYEYIQAGKLRKNLSSNKTMVSIEDCYKLRKIREEKKL